MVWLLGTLHVVQEGWMVGEWENAGRGKMAGSIIIPRALNNMSNYVHCLLRTSGESLQSVEISYVLEGQHWDLLEEG